MNKPKKNINVEPIVELVGSYSVLVTENGQRVMVTVKDCASPKEAENKASKLEGVSKVWNSWPS